MSWAQSYLNAYKRTLIVLAVMAYMADGTCEMIPKGDKTYGNCGNYYYDRQLGPINQCLESCIINYWCQGVAYNNKTSECIRFTCKKFQVTHSPFEFYSLDCTRNREFPLRGQPTAVYTMAKNQTGGCDPYFLATYLSADDCKYTCNSHDECRGVVYDVHTLECVFYNCPETNKNKNLTLTYYRKWTEYSLCSYKDLGLGTMGECGPLSSPPLSVTSLEECLSLCEEINQVSGQCLGVTYKPSSQGCVLQTCNEYINETTNTGYQFLVRECPTYDPDTVCPWEEVDTTSGDFCLKYDTFIGSIEECFRSCELEDWCNGVWYIPKPQLCFRYPCTKRNHLVRGFYSRKYSETSIGDVQVPTGHVTTIIEDLTTLNPDLPTVYGATTDMHSITSEENTATFETVATYTESYCTCQCQSSYNETFQAFYDRIVQPLKVNKKTLSSSIRKLNSVDDSRISAVQVGSCGVVCLVLAVAIVALCDISSFNDRRRINDRGRL